MARMMRILMTGLAALLLAAWHAPCCCQSAWAVQELATQLADAPEKGCACCQEQGQPSRGKKCCPLGTKGCKQTVGKAAVAKAGVQVAPAGYGWMLTTHAPSDGREFRWSVPTRWRMENPPDRVSTLLGLGCALNT